MRYLFDTSALLAHFRQEVGWEQVQALFEAEDTEAIVASVSFTEFGRRLIDLGATVSAAETILANYSLLVNHIAVVDINVAMAAFQLGSQTPQRLPLIDALICGAAQVHDAALVHRDAHMASVPTDLLHQIDLAANESRDPS